MFVTSGSISAEADDRWLKRCEKNLVSGVDVFKCRIFPVSDGSDNGGSALTFRVLGGCDCDFFGIGVGLLWHCGSGVGGGLGLSCPGVSGDRRLDSSSSST